MEHTIKKYRLTSVGNNLELGKRGGMIKYDLLSNAFEFYDADKVTLSPIKISSGTANDHAVNVSQLNALKQSFVAPLEVLSVATTMAANKKYYLTSNVVLKLPDTSGVSVGDIIVVRSSNAVTSASVDVYDAVNDDITTSVGTTTTFTIDIMGEYTFVYAGSNVWEVL